MRSCRLLSGAGVNELSPKTAVVVPPLRCSRSSASQRNVRTGNARLSWTQGGGRAAIWLLAFGGGEHKEASREVRARSGAQRMNALRLLVWVHGRGGFEDEVQIQHLTGEGEI